MALTDYKSSLETAVEKDSLTGKYTVNTSVYAFANKVKEQSVEYNFSPASADPFPAITGVYQSLNPSTYRTDTYVVGAPIDLTSNYGVLKNAFTNCVSLTSIDLTVDAKFPPIQDVGFLNLYEYSYAFAGCRSLTTVNLSDTVGEWDDGQAGTDDINCESMFDGCSSLTTITGTIDISNSREYQSLKNMFRGCINLQSVTIKHDKNSVRNGSDLTAQNVTIGGTTYNYAYEYLGLTSSQMNNVVTLIDAQ